MSNTTIVSQEKEFTATARIIEEFGGCEVLASPYSCDLTTVRRFGKMGQGWPGKQARIYSVFGKMVAHLPSYRCQLVAISKSRLGLGICGYGRGR